MAQSCPSSLMDLPDVILDIILAGLAAPDKAMVVAACRKTFQLTMHTAEPRLRITKDTQFAGIKKVLDGLSAQVHLDIICTSFKQENATPMNQDATSALAVFMGIAPYDSLYEVASNCRWESITKVTIQGMRLRCLLPKFIALACPQLTQLRIIRRPSGFGFDLPKYVFSPNPEDALPLTFCSTLKQLELDVEHRTEFELPAVHHSPAELRRHLPKIHTLIMIGVNIAVLEAFTTQLTRLVISKARETPPAHQSSNSSFMIQHLRTVRGFLPINGSLLRVLDWPSCSDDDMRVLLQLPNLTTVCLGCIDVKEDWSSHVCSWQELHIQRLMFFAQLAKLNLSNLKQLTIGSNQDIDLPITPDRLTAVQQAVDNLAHVGIIVVKPCKEGAEACFGQCGAFKWGIAIAPEYERTQADAIAIAAERISPARVCYIENLLHRPLILHAVVRWGRTSLESVCLGHMYHPGSHVWQELQQLHDLSTVVFWPRKSNRQDFGPDTANGRIYDERLNIVTAVATAAKQYVIPANRSLRVEFGMFSLHQEHAFSKEGRSILETAVRNSMPTECKLTSIEVSSMQGNVIYTHYDGMCHANVFWVLLIEPSQRLA